MVRITKFMESVVIICLGLTLHLNQWSIVEFRQSDLPALVPNVASTLFTFSLLCILNKMRPFWPRNWYRPKRLVAFLIEMTLILFAADFLLRQIWIPSLKLLNFMCNFMGQHIMITMAQRAPILSQWIRKEAFFVARFLLALIAFILMLDTTGMIELAVSKVKHRFAVSVAGGSSPSSRLRDEIKLHRHGLPNNFSSHANLNDSSPAPDISSSSNHSHITANAASAMRFYPKRINLVWEGQEDVEEMEHEVESLEENAEYAEYCENFENFENDLYDLTPMSVKECDYQTNFTPVFKSNSTPNATLNDANSVTTEQEDVANVCSMPKPNRPKRSSARRHARHSRQNADNATIANSHPSNANDSECNC